MIGKLIVFFTWTFGLWMLLACLVSLPTMLLWNWLVSDIFGLREITWLEASGLILLISCLCGARVKVDTEEDPRHLQ